MKVSNVWLCLGGGEVEFTRRSLVSTTCLPVCFKLLYKTFSVIFQGVHFPFCHFPCRAFSVLSCIFCHFPVCEFSVIFRVVHFPFCHVFSAIFQCVNFLPFSVSCIFRFASVLPFSCCAISVLSFSVSGIFSGPVSLKENNEICNMFILNLCFII